MFSGANFVLHIALARWLSAADYGGFAVVMALFMILAGIQNALVLEPMSVFGAKKSVSELRTYLANLFWPHNGVTAGIVLLSIASLPLLTLLSVGSVKWALPISAPLILAYWAVRRICYLRQNPKAAFTLSATYATLLLLGLIALRSSELLTGFAAFLLLGTAAGISVVPSLIRLRHSQLLSKARLVEDSLVSRHWSYGKWALGETFMSSLTGPVYPLMIAFFGGLAQAGAFRAIQNLVLPLTQVTTALVLLVLPRMATIYATDGISGLAQRTFMTTGIFVALTVAYLLPTIAGGFWLLETLYGNSEYVASLWLLPYFGVVAVHTAVAIPLGMALRVAERPDQIFWSRIGSSTITVVLGVYLGTILGMRGLAIALVMSTFTGMVLIGWFSRPLIQAMLPRSMAHEDARDHK